MKDVYIVQCLMETDLYKLLKTQVKRRIIWKFTLTLQNSSEIHKMPKTRKEINLSLTR